MSDEHAELKKEFELERMILFSDAVFAIAITLLIIEIKFPEIEKGASTEETLHAFKPVAIRFLGFMLSFFFIGAMWSRHLKLFKYLKTYDNGIIARNLIFLFFIVCFPFTASGLTEHMSPRFLIPIFIYFINITCVWTSQYFLSAYILKSRTMAIPGFEDEKKYILMQSKYLSLSLIITLAVTISLSFILDKGSPYTLYGFYIMIFCVAIMRKALRKYKPIKKIVTA